MANTEAEMGLEVRGLERAGLVERLQRFIPGPDSLVTNRQVEPAHSVLRFELNQRTIGLGRLLIVLQFELNVAHRAIDFGGGLSPDHRAHQMLQSLLVFPGKVQGYGSCEMTRAGIGGLWRQRGSNGLNSGTDGGSTH